MLQKIKEYCIILVHCVWGWGVSTLRKAVSGETFFWESHDFARIGKYLGGNEVTKILFLGGLRFFEAKFWDNITFLEGVLGKHGSAQTAFETAVTPILC